MAHYYHFSHIYTILGDSSCKFDKTIVPEQAERGQKSLCSANRVHIAESVHFENKS